MAAFDPNAAFNKKYTQQQVEAAHKELWKWPNCLKYWKLPRKPPYVYQTLLANNTPDILQQICKIWGLPIKGKKEDLAKRIYTSSQNACVTWSYQYYTKLKKQQKEKQQQQQ